MGKGEENNTEDSDEETKSKPEEVKEETTEEESSEEKNKETKKPEEKKESDQKKNTEDLRKVIKVGLSEDGKKEGEDANIDENSREGLEQKRAILQSIKDFDFQIKKNQEEITSVNKKLDTVSKDLDDLVSLYEIVSEQMNPFVGLSKVTKKRIDALENFTKEIDDLKARMGDMESFAVRAGADLTNIREHKDSEDEVKHIETIEEKIKHELGESEVETGEEVEKTDEEEKLEPEQKEPVQPQEQIPPQQTVIQPQTATPQQQTTNPQYEFTTVSDDFGLDEIDNIIERSLSLLSIEYQLDKVIDEFIESLKT